MNNILMLYHRLPYPPNKGDKIRAHQQIAHLSPRHRIWLACFVDCSEDHAHAVAVARLCHRFQPVALNRQAALSRGGWSVLCGRTLTEGYYGSRAMWRVLQQWRQEVHFDAALAFSSSMAPYIEDLPCGRRVLDMNDFDSHKWRTYSAQSGWPISEILSLEAGRLEAREREFLRKFDLTLVVNERERQRLTSGAQTVRSRRGLRATRKGADVAHSPGAPGTPCDGTAARPEPPMTGTPGAAETGGQSAPNGAPVCAPRRAGGAGRAAAPHAAARAASPGGAGSAAHGALDGAAARIAVLSTPMDLEHYRAAWGVPDSKVIGYTGTLDYRPNAEAVLWFAREVWPGVAQRHADASWWIVGRRPPREIQRLAADPRIRVTGEVEDIREYLAQMRIYAAPCLSDIGVQTKVLEALAAGRPVVISQTGHEGLIDYAKPPYRIAATAAAFVEHLSSLLDDPLHCHELGTAGVEFIRRHYNAAVLLPRFEALLCGLDQSTGGASGAGDVADQTAALAGAAHHASAGAGLGTS